VSSGPQLVPNAARPEEPEPRNWLPLVIAVAVVLVAAALVVLMPERTRPVPTVASISAAKDAYATSLPITDLAMSESANLAGGKVTYVDGHIANTGSKTVTGITVQVLFRTFAHEVAQNESQQMKLIRTRDPYVDLEPVSSAPLAPGGAADFRLIFDTVSPDWDGAYPEIRVLHVDTK
jgi:hypothetical protein